jgi:hypothetical protein
MAHKEIWQHSQCPGLLKSVFTSFFFNIVRKIDAFMFLDVVIVIFVICLHFDSLIDILTNATSSSAMSL